MKIKDYFKAMYESTTIIIDDDNSDIFPPPKSVKQAPSPT